MVKDLERKSALDDVGSRLSLYCDRAQLIASMLGDEFSSNSMDVWMFPEFVGQVETMAHIVFDYLSMIETCSLELRKIIDEMYESERMEKRNEHA